MKERTGPAFVTRKCSGLSCKSSSKVGAEEALRICATAACGQAGGRTREVQRVFRPPRFADSRPRNGPRPVICTTQALTWPLLSPAENPCLGEVVREVIRRQKGYASCATASKVPIMECRGGCGPQCCQPTRSKRRKYVFQCTDGSSFVEEVERHLECGCRPCS